MPGPDMADLSTRLAGSGTSLASGFRGWNLASGLVFSVLGMVYVKLGRQSSDVPKILCGCAMLVYPYFVSDALCSLLIGLALAAAPFALERF